MKIMNEYFRSNYIFKGFGFIELSSIKKHNDPLLKWNYVIINDM
jgi:hypothetical protein